MYLENTDEVAKQYDGGIILHPGAKVFIGENNEIGWGCYFQGNVKIGNNNKISPYVSIGTPGEHKYMDPTESALENGVEIGDNNIIREFVTINAPVETKSIVGNDCYLMAKSHIGHDGKLGNNVVLSTGAEVGGHSILDDFVTLGLNAITHQWTFIGAFAMIGALCPVNNDALPFTLLRGVPARWFKINTVGMGRENRLQKHEIDEALTIYTKLINQIQSQNSNEITNEDLQKAIEDGIQSKSILHYFQNYLKFAKRNVTKMA